jgi:hypothetical protein
MEKLLDFTEKNESISLPFPFFFLLGTKIEVRLKSLKQKLRGTAFFVYSQSQSHGNWTPMYPGRGKACIFSFLLEKRLSLTSRDSHLSLTYWGWIAGILQAPSSSLPTREIHDLKRLD